MGTSIAVLKWSKLQVSRYVYDVRYMYFLLLKNNFQRKCVCGGGGEGAIIYDVLDVS